MVNIRQRFSEDAGQAIAFMKPEYPADGAIRQPLLPRPSLIPVSPREPVRLL